ncbi:beach domain containing protein, partial [Entamoeba invadens IP1]
MDDAAIRTLWEDVQHFQYKTPSCRSLLLTEMYTYGKTTHFDSSLTPVLSKDTTLAVLSQIFQETQDHPEYILLTKFINSYDGLIDVLPLLLPQISIFLSHLATDKTTITVLYAAALMEVFYLIVSPNLIDKQLADFFTHLPEDLPELLHLAYNIAIQNQKKGPYSLLVKNTLFFFYCYFSVKVTTFPQFVEEFINSILWDGYGKRHEGEDWEFYVSHQIGLTQILFAFLVLTESKNEEKRKELPKLFLRIFEDFVFTQEHMQMKQFDKFLLPIVKNENANFIVLAMELIVEQLPPEGSPFVIATFNIISSCFRNDVLILETRQHLVNTMLLPKNIETFSVYHEYHILLNNLASSNQGQLFRQFYTNEDYKNCITKMLQNTIEKVTPGLLVNFCVLLEFEKNVNEKLPILMHCIVHFVERDPSLALFCAKQLHTIVHQSFVITKENVHALVDLFDNSINKQVIFTIIELFATLLLNFENRVIIKSAFNHIKTKVIGLGPLLQTEVLSKMFVMLCSNATILNRKLVCVDTLSSSSPPLIVTFSSMYPLMLELIIQNNTKYIQKAFTDLVAANSFNTAKFCTKCFSSLMHILAQLDDSDTKEFLVSLASIAFTPSCSVQQMRWMMREAMQSDSFFSDNFVILKKVLEETSSQEYHSFFFRGSSNIQSHYPAPFNLNHSSIVLWFNPQTINDTQQTLLTFSSPEGNALSVSLLGKSIILEISDKNVFKTSLDNVIGQDHWYCAVFTFQTLQKNPLVLVNSYILAIASGKVDQNSSSCLFSQNLVTFSDEMFGATKVGGRLTNFFIGHISSCLIFPATLSRENVEQIRKNSETYRSQPELFGQSTKKVFLLSVTPVDVQNLISETPIELEKTRIEIIESHSNIHSFQMTGSFRYIFCVYEKLYDSQKNLKVQRKFLERKRQNFSQSEEVQIARDTSLVLPKKRVKWNLKEMNTNLFRSENALTFTQPNKQIRSLIGNNRSKKTEEVIKETPESIALDALLSILLSVVKNPKMKEEFEGTKCVMYLHYLLLKHPTSGISESNVVKLIQLSDIFKEGETQKKFSEIFFDLRIWAGCPIDIQVYIISKITFMKGEVDVMRMVLMMELTGQPTGMVKSLRSIKEEVKDREKEIGREEKVEIHSNYISALFQVAINKIGIENVLAFTHYLYMIRDDEFIRDTLDVLVIHLHNNKKEYQMYSEQIVNGCINIQSIVPFKQQYKVLSIIFLFLDVVMVSNINFDYSTITLLILNCIFVAKEFDTNLYYLLIAQQQKVQTLVDVPKICFFGMRYVKSQQTRDEMCDMVHNKTVHDNFPVTAFDIPQTPLVMMNCIQLAENKTKYYNLLRVFIIKKMTNLMSKNVIKAEEFSDFLMSGAFYFNEQMELQNDTESILILFFVFEQLNLQIRPKALKLKEKAMKDKGLVTRIVCSYFARSYELLHKVQCELLERDDFNDAKCSSGRSCIMLLLSLAKEMNKLPKENMKMQNGFGKSLGIDDIIFHALITLLYISVRDKKSLNECVNELIRFVNEPKFEVTLCVGCFYALKSITDVSQYNEVRRIFQKLGPGVVTKIKNEVSSMQEQESVDTTDAILFSDIINGMPVTTSELPRVRENECMKRVKDVLVLDEKNGMNYQLDLETILLVIKEKNSEFGKTVNATNSVIVKKFGEKLNEIQPIIESNKGQIKRLVEELNEDLSQKESAWKRYVEGRGEFRDPLLHD